MTEVLNEATPDVVVRAPGRFYRPELDGVRFYAFLGVFVAHTLPYEANLYRSLHLPLPWFWGGMVKAGAAGVDLFFALSAFLITSLLMKERRETGDISLRHFYLRRVLRIWPLYFLVIGLGVVFAHSLPNQHLPWYYVAGYLLFVGNWVHAFMGRPESISFPLWTVSIEEQFYLIWPLVMKKLERRGIIVAACITFFVATAFRIGFVLAGVSGGFIYYGSTSRCDSLAIGILMAMFADRLPILSRAGRVAIVAVSVLGWILASAWLTDQPGPVTMLEIPGRLIIALGGGAILYACLYSRSKLLISPAIVSLGKVSYGLYLLHLTGLLIAKSVLHPVSGKALLASKAVGFVITIGLAFASYRWVETPFLRLKDRFATVLSRPV